jgi:hypothetical protein
MSLGGVMSVSEQFFVSSNENVSSRGANVATMITKLCLADLSTGTEGTANVFEGSVIPVGRDPESGVCVLEEGISRRHGRFFRGGSHWFYHDIGSLNGSFLNGLKLDAGVRYLVRDGDILQLADICLRVRESTEAGLVGQKAKRLRSKGVVIVLNDDELVGEFEAVGDGTVCIFGGTGSNFRLDGDNSSFPTLVIEMVDREAFAYRVTEEFQPEKFGREIVGRTRIEHRAVLNVGRYTVIYEAPLKDSDDETERDALNWISKKSKRSTPVQLVELRPQVAARGSGGLGSGVSPLSETDIFDDITANTALIKSSRAMALVTNAVTSSASLSKSSTGSYSRRESEQSLERQRRATRLVIEQIWDTMFVISGVLGLFIIIFSVGLLVLLLKGYNLQVLLGM